MLFYRIVRRAFLIFAGAFFRFRVAGLENFPESGPGVVVAPHRSWFDPPAVGAASPRPMRFLIRDQVYEGRLTRWFYRAMRSIPVTPGGIESITALRAALSHLRQGGVIAIFPEGTVLPEGDLGRVHPGAAMLAVRLQAPVIPMVIEGSARAWPKGRIPRPAPVNVLIGKPIQPPEGRSREVVDAFLHTIAHTLRELGAKGESR